MIKRVILTLIILWIFIKSSLLLSWILCHFITCIKPFQLIINLFAIKALLSFLVAKIITPFLFIKKVLPWDLIVILKNHFRFAYFYIWLHLLSKFMILKWKRTAYFFILSLLILKSKIILIWYLIMLRWNRRY